MNEVGEASRPTEPPATFDEYRIVGELGSGAMGRVYLAQDTLLDRTVALKLIAERHPNETTRRHFFAEARALGRLSHPNVVTVHRVGEVRGQPYLVTELIRGKSLSELTMPMPFGDVVSIGEGLARGLSAAHAKGVLHRDIKPANAVMGENGEVKLIDFGLAIMTRESVEPGAIDARAAPGKSGDELAGTPLYMAPEVLRGMAASRRSDIYSLGAVLYELCTGVAHRETLPPDAELSTWIEGAGDPVEQRAPGIDARLAAAVQRCLAPSPEARFPSADALADALAVLGAAPPDTPPEGNPYRGLAAFEAEHRALFFGRAAETHAVVDRLRETAITVVSGDSGVGKSSLCRAGVLPLAEGGALGDGRRYRALTFVPGKHPLAALMAALGALSRLDEAELGRDVAEDPSAPARALRRALGAEQGALLFIDQAEELVTLADPAEARLFSEVLSRLPSGPGGVRVLLAARGDFFTRLAALPGLGEDLARALYLLRPLSGEGVRAAITGPAQQQGVTFEPLSLIDDLAAAADTPGGLPLLQFALAQLWEARGSAAVITPDLLEKLGGVGGALARHATEVIASLTPAARAEARPLMVSLVTADRTRARRSGTELHTEVPARRAALEALVHGRLIVAREVDGDTAYELSHEALIWGWETLQSWLDEGGQDRVRIARLEEAAKAWNGNDRGPELLLGAKRLGELEGLSPEAFSEQARLFLEASRARVRAARWRRGLLLAAAPAVIAAALGGLKWKQDRDLGRLIEGHTSAAAASRREGQQKLAEANEKRLRAYALFDAASGDSAEEVSRKKEDAEKVWAEALSASHEAEKKLVIAGQSLESALALDPARAVIRAAIGDVTVERIALAEAFHVEDRRADLMLRLGAYDPDQSRQKALHAAPVLTLLTEPAGATAQVERYENREGRLVPVVVGTLGPTPIRGVALAGGPGSYRLTLRAPGRVEVRYPVLLGAGERFEAEVPLPAEKDAPEGYVFVPAGRFLMGSADPEPLRKGFLACTPIHETQTRAYWIAKTEVTFGEWLAFLDTLPAEEMIKHVPSAQTGMWGTRLERDGTAWQLTMKLNGAPHVAKEGEPIHLSARNRRSTLDWRRIPVTGISMESAAAYFRWLDESGRVRHARACTEREWERAARGADARPFPHGYELGEDDANFDLTYGRVQLAYGPDQVGEHPASESPFGLFDMTGNAYELTSSVSLVGEVVIRGGTWYYDSMSAVIQNRSIGEMRTSDHLTGIRSCVQFVETQ